MSFFDEADEPRTATQTAPRRRRSSGSGRRPPSEQQSIQVRRAVAAGVLLVVLILIVLGVHSCQVSSRNSALKDYTNNVSSLVQQSDQTGVNFFKLLSTGAAGSVSGLQSSINEARRPRRPSSTKAREAERAQRDEGGADEPRAGAPDAPRRDRQRRRRRSSRRSAPRPARTRSTRSPPRWPRFYASDVVYKNYTTPLIASALHGAGIAVGGANGESIDGGQFVSDLGWLDPTFVATKLGAKSSSGYRQDRPWAPRPRAELGQRRRHHAPARIDQHPSGQSAARRSR